jgi:hypothetical protein
LLTGLLLRAVSHSYALEQHQIWQNILFTETLRRACRQGRGDRKGMAEPIFADQFGVRHGKDPNRQINLGKSLAAIRRNRVGGLIGVAEHLEVQVRSRSDGTPA